MVPPLSHSHSVLPNAQLLVLECITREENRFVIAVHAHQTARCPACGEVSKSRHSEYVRVIQDLPWQGMPVFIQVRLRRFRCRNPVCSRRVFAERLPGIAGGQARRTDRLGAVVRLVGYSMGGLPGSRVLHRLAVQLSDDTILRAVKAGVVTNGDADESIRHLGVDDWAWRKGQRYGTILVDLERHRVVDLLPDRSADDLNRWLQQHPTVQTINRDRCGTYADGANRGAPEAVQIADRFHLVLNLSAAVERVLEAERKNLAWELGPQDTDVTVPVTISVTAAQQRSKQRREHRLERYNQVTTLDASGYTQQAISDSVGICLKTVRRWLRAGQFPERKPVLNRRSHIREFAPYLKKRWEQGCHNSAELFREIRLGGYQGSRQMVSYFVASWRKQSTTTRPKGPERLAPKQATVLLCKRAEDRSAVEQKLFERLTEKIPTCTLVNVLAVEFRDALQRRDPEAIRRWINNTIQCGIRPLVRFAWGLHRDLHAVIAAAGTEWSSGQVEGQINRLKTIKRQMYGRASFTLLRSRVLPDFAHSPP